MKLLTDIIIAIDGYSSAGKSTLARALANILNYTHIDSGAMYRAVTLFCIRNKILINNFFDANKFTLLSSFINLYFKKNNDNLNIIYLNDENVDEEIRKPYVSEVTSIVSQFKEVRNFILEIQREMGKNKRIVMDGRDIGTVVFPQAEFKIFVTASLDVRAKRRLLELQQKGINMSYEEVLKNIKERDYMDSHREIAPLKKPNDAILLDNSYMTKEEQLSWAVNELKKRFPYEN
ncbi:MAG: (d)CMP kinase [Bacteroidales bacterium]|nr:(d)CMP kinase [Bacteroidales bacterium]